MFKVSLAAALCLLAVLSCSSGPNMQEGEWEISTEVGMKGIPIKMPAMSHTQCLSRENSIPQTINDSSCTLLQNKIEGDTVSWEMVCDDNTATTKSEGFITYNGVLFSGKIDVTISGGPMAVTATNTITGKYLGPCNN